MKRMIYALAIIALVTALSSYSFAIPTAKAGKALDITKYINPNVGIDSRLQLFDKKGNETQAITYRPIASAQAGSAFLYMEKISPIAYDPSSNSVYIVFSDWAVVGNNIDRFHVWAKRTLLSSGTKWDSVKVFDETGMGGVKPSITINNYQNKTAVADIPFTVVARAYNNTGTKFEFGADYFLYYKNGRDYADEFTGPTSNNPNSENQWESMKLKSILSADEGLTIGMGTLSPTTANTQYGQYGIFTWSLTNMAVDQSRMPIQWGLDKFKTAPDMIHSYQSGMEFDVNNNNIYAAVNNLFVENDTYRVPGVSKSTDKGDTWSEFNQMPYSALATYATDQGFDLALVADPFKMDAFVATGDDEYSYFEKLVMLSSTDTVDHLVECYYKGSSSTWGIRKVAEIVGTPSIITVVWDSVTATKWPYYYQADPLGNELQVAKTADGKNLLLKWIDINPNYSYTFTPPVQVLYTYTDPNTSESSLLWGNLPGTYSTDIYFSARAVGSDTWSTPNNATKDTVYDKLTFIPNIIPSLDEVPLIRSSTGYYAAGHPTTQYPDIINQQNAGMGNFIYYTKLIKPATVGVEDNTISVATNVLNNAYPNPASGKAEISFVLPNGGNASLELFNALGQRVDVVFSNMYQAPGIHAKNLDVTKFNSGVYYFTLTVNGQRYTKSLNIVK